MKLVNAEEVQKYIRDYGHGAIEDGKKSLDPVDDILAIAKIVDFMPGVDAAEVVRCKECRKWHEEIGWCDEHSYFVDSEGMACSPADSPSWKMFPPDYFCKDGERKTE